MRPVSNTILFDGHIHTKIAYKSSSEIFIVLSSNDTNVLFGSSNVFESISCARKAIFIYIFMLVIFHSKFGYKYRWVPYPNLYECM